MPGGRSFAGVAGERPAASSRQMILGPIPSRKVLTTLLDIFFRILGRFSQGVGRGGLLPHLGFCVAPGARREVEQMLIGVLASQERRGVRLPPVIPRESDGEGCKSTGALGQCCLVPFCRGYQELALVWTFFPM